MTRTTRFLRTILQFRHILLTEARTFTSPSPAASRPDVRLLPLAPTCRCSGYRTTPVRP